MVHARTNLLRLQIDAASVQPIEHFIHRQIVVLRRVLLDDYVSDCAKFELSFIRFQSGVSQPLKAVGVVRNTLRKL